MGDKKTLMDSGIVDNQLNLALDVPEDVRERTRDLDVGYEPETNTWELIIKYSGSLDRMREDLDIGVVELSGGYAIITIAENLIDKLLNYEEIEFIEKPKRLFYEVMKEERLPALIQFNYPLIICLAGEFW